MAGFQDRDDLFVPVGDLDLWHEFRIGLALEDRLHAVCLAADAVDSYDLGTVRKLVDVVANVSVGRWEDNAALAFHRNQLLPQMQSHRTFAVVCPSIHLVSGCLQRFDHCPLSISAKVTTLFLP